MKKIPPEDIVAFAPFCGLYPIEVDPVYANAGHPENFFGQIYRPDAQIWGHRDLVEIVLLTARRLHDAQGWTLVVKDCLRTVEAQARIMNAPISKANPHWFEEPRFMSPPGRGAHPRGMAVDVGVRGVDMGTGYDDMTPKAARNFSDLPAQVLRNRKILEEAFVSTGQASGLTIHPLSNEWWDFRLTADHYNQFAPLSEDDLRPEQRMT